MMENKDTNRVMSATSLVPGAEVIPPPSQAKIAERKKTLKLLISSAERNLQFLNKELIDLENYDPEKPKKRQRRNKSEERFLKYYNKIR